MSVTAPLTFASGCAQDEIFLNKVASLLDSQGAVKAELVLPGQVPRTLLASPC